LRVLAMPRGKVGWSAEGAGKGRITGQKQRKCAELAVCTGLCDGLEVGCCVHVVCGGVLKICDAIALLVDQSTALEGGGVVAARI